LLIGDLFVIAVKRITNKSKITNHKSPTNHQSQIAKSKIIRPGQP